MVEGDVQDLLQRAAAGDREAAGELARRYEGPVLAKLHGRLGNDLRSRIDTEDLFQSTITAALRGLPGLEYRGEKAFVRWLSKVAERQVLMKARHGRAGMRDVGRQRPLEAAADRAASLTSPSEGAVRGELTASLQEALTRLPDQERRVVELHSFEGRNFEEVAGELGLSGKSSAYRIFERALRKIGAILDAEDGDRTP